jgi:hypothetical protein
MKLSPAEKGRIKEFLRGAPYPPIYTKFICSLLRENGIHKGYLESRELPYVYKTDADKDSIQAS